MTISEDVFAMLLIHIERGWQRQDLVTQNEREIEDFEIYLVRMMIQMSRFNLYLYQTADRLFKESG